MSSGIFKRNWDKSLCTACGSGQTKQIFGRNTETETRPPGIAEILAETKNFAETEILAETRFSAKTVYFGRNVLFRPEQYMVLH